MKIVKSGMMKYDTIISNIKKRGVAISVCHCVMTNRSYTVIRGNDINIDENIIPGSVNDEES